MNDGDNISPGARRLALCVVVINGLAIPMMLPGLNVAIPAIIEAFDSNALAATWIQTAYLLTCAVFLLPMGKLADLHGYKRILASGMLIASVGAVLATASGTIETLIFWRGVQGIGAAMQFATGAAILASVYPPRRLGSVMGVSIASVYFGGMCAPVVAGWITAAYGWKFTMLCPLPALLLNCALVLWKLPTTTARSPGARLDITGTVIYGMAITGLLFGFSALPEWRGAVMILLGLAGAAIFVGFERRAADPLIDPMLFVTTPSSVFRVLPLFSSIRVRSA